MTTDRTYRCNLCGDYIEPTQGSSKPGFGVFISGDGRAFKRVHETERHICHQCARNVHDEWRKVTPAPPPAPEGEKKCLATCRAVSRVAVISRGYAPGAAATAGRTLGRNA